MQIELVFIGACRWAYKDFIIRDVVLTWILGSIFFKTAETRVGLEFEIDSCSNWLLSG